MKICVWLFIFLPILGSLACGPDERCQPAVPGLFETNFSWECADTDDDGIGENYVTSIKRQSDSDCYIYSAVATIETQLQINLKIDTNILAEIDLSEEAIHTCFNIAKDVGGDPITIFGIAKNYGLIKEEDFEKDCPYFQKNSNLLQVFKIGHYEDLWTIDSVREYRIRKEKLISALQKGPVTVLFNHWGAFLKKDGVLVCNPNDLKNRGAHAVVAVGYKNYGEVIIVKNSLGEKNMLEIRFDQTAIDECDFFIGASWINPQDTQNMLLKTPFPELDIDGDNIPDEIDNCPMKPNVDQENTDGDIFGDTCDKCKKLSGKDGLSCPWP